MAKQDPKFEINQLMAEIPQAMIAIIKLTVLETTTIVLKEHRENCPVNDLKNDMYGNGKPGIKATVAEHAKSIDDVKAIQATVAENSKCIDDIKGAKSFLREIAKTVIAAIIIALIFIFAPFLKGNENSSTQSRDDTTIQKPQINADEHR